MARRARGARFKAGRRAAEDRQLVGVHLRPPFISAVPALLDVFTFGRHGDGLLHGHPQKAEAATGAGPGRRRGPRARHPRRDDARGRSGRGAGVC